MAKEKLSFPSKPFRTPGGARVPHRKNTADVQSLIMPSPKTVTIPMQQHIGAPCKPVVAVGDTVYVGTVIGDSEAFVCAPIHSSVSGTVKSIVKITLPGGANTDAVVIESDGLDTPDPEIKPPVVENVQDFLKAVRASGLVGLGGAGFPAHVKLSVPEGKNIDTLLINCAECEPYITADNREVIENSWAVMSGVYSVLELLGIDRVIIGVENNKPEAIKILREIADNEQYDPEDRVRILPLKASYPQGAEKVLIKACTGREVPAGKLPADAGCIVMNVTSIAFISDYLKTGMPLTKKRLTIDGSAIKEPKNVIVPIGTPINEVMEFCGGYKCEPKKILMGGPMMGLAVSDDTLPILKQNNAILAFDEKEARLSQATDCIRCGRCVDACPMRLVPTKLCADIKLKDFDGMKKHQLMTCMECGSCAYSCPAHRHIVQTIRMGKSMLRAQMAKEKEAKK
ncbi:MAG: electron transport complex subunit RsxC [Ruminococcus sp.]|nr:electron transport complex subunit RsxC [Ruminococcus sp.]